MKTILDDVRHEIVERHEFFTKWFNGTIQRDQLESQFLSRLHPDFIIVSPRGAIVTYQNLKEGFHLSYGSNTEIRIQIQDVELRHVYENRVLATYSEWQSGLKDSDDPNSARYSTVLMDIGQPMTWLHVHETWLPETVRAAGPFDF